MTPAKSPSEEVVLLDETGHSVGTAPKAEVHTSETPLHLAFSCYVFDSAGRLLITRRADTKRTWPGVWTNTVCGHPQPHEPLPDAVRRRARDELGVELDDVRLLLPTFRYRATMGDGTVEHEWCPVFVATTTDAVRADASEVGDHDWVEWRMFRQEVSGGRRPVSPWCVEQIAELPEDPVASPSADEGLLPPAARTLRAPPR